MVFISYKLNIYQLIKITTIEQHQNILIILVNLKLKISYLYTFPFCFFFDVSKQIKCDQLCNFLFIDISARETFSFVERRIF